MAGPLDGVRIIELAGIGPGPFAAMMLADHGAEVIRIDRAGARRDPSDPLLRSRKSVLVDLKHPDGIAAVRALARTADGLIEGYRPGVTERLGLGPDVLLADNPQLVYGRMTGWGQTGPYAQAAGHDINYIALSGVLHGVGRAGQAPVPPANLVGDFGGGGMMLAFGMVSALLAVRAGQPGRVIDCAMTDGSALLAAMLWGFKGAGRWRDARGVNILDGGAPFYDSYRCSDGAYVAIGSIEPQFYALLRAALGIEADPLFDAPFDPSKWTAQKARLAEIFATRTRDQWCAEMEHSDICFAPVLSMNDAPAHPHNAARGTFIDVGGVIQPGPAPRYPGAEVDPPRPTPEPGADTDALLTAAGLDVASLRRAGAVG